MQKEKLARVLVSHCTEMLLLLTFVVVVCSTFCCMLFWFFDQAEQDPVSRSQPSRYVKFHWSCILLDWSVFLPWNPDIVVHFHQGVNFVWTMCTTKFFSDFIRRVTGVGQRKNLFSQEDCNPRPFSFTLTWDDPETSAHCFLIIWKN